MWSTLAWNRGLKKLVGVSHRMCHNAALAVTNAAWGTVELFVAAAQKDFGPSKANASGLDFIMLHRAQGPRQGVG